MNRFSIHIYTICNLKNYVQQIIFNWVSVRKSGRWNAGRGVFNRVPICRPTREFFIHLETSPLPAMAVNFDRCSALMAIMQWRFFSVPHLLWLGAFVYNGHLRGPVTLTPIAKRLAVKLSLIVFIFRWLGERSHPLRHRCDRNELCRSRERITNPTKRVS